MTADVFIDTNIFLYTVDEDPASAPKRDRAREILLNEPWGWSIQVAAEFFVNATSSKRPFRLATADASQLIETWLSFPTAPLTPETVRVAIALHERFSLSYWDAAILAAAAQLGCRTVYSEDLSHGQQYDAVQVLNPFLAESSVSPA